MGWKALPDTLYVAVEGDSEDDSFFNAHDNPDAHADGPEPVSVGVYRLERMVHVSTQVTVVENGKPNKKRK